MSAPPFRKGQIGVYTDGVTITGDGQSPGTELVSTGGTTYFNVAAYGATGNGVTDDTTAIRAAAAAAQAAGGGTVYFPNATNGTEFYLVSEHAGSFVCLNMFTGVSWLGQSRDGVVIQLALNQRASVRVFSTTGSGIQDFTIQSLTVDGNGPAQVIPDSNHRDNIFLWNATRVTVIDCELRNATGSGIVVFGLGGSDVKVDHCYMHDNHWMGISWGDAGETFRTHVTHCYFTRNANGLHIEVSQPNGEILFDHCWMDGNNGQLALSIGGALSPNQTQNIWVRNCTVAGGLNIVNAQDIVIDGNVIFCNDSSVDNTVPLLVDGDAQDVYIAHNEITLGIGGTAVAAVWLTASANTASTFDGISFHDNVVYVQTTTAAGIRLQPGAVRAERNKVIAFGATAWMSSTTYSPYPNATKAMRVTNGGNVYQCIAGTSAASGGPTGTGAGIIDGTVVWNYISAGSGQPQWQSLTAYYPGTLVRNGGNIYEAVAGTSAGSGGPTGTGSAIADGTVVWEYVGAAGANQYGIDLNMSVARSGDLAIIRGNYVADFTTGIVTQAAASSIKVNYADISDNIFDVITPGVMTNCIQWEVDTRASINFPRCSGNVCIANAATLIGSYPAAALLIGGNYNDAGIYSCASAPAFAAAIGSMAIARTGGSSTTQYVNQTGLSGGWVALVTVASGVGQILGQGPYSANWQSGRYYGLPNFGSLNTNNNLGVGTMRCLPFWVPNAITVSELDVEVTAGGDSTSVYRMGIYADDGTGRPGALLLDAGTVLANSGGAGVPGVQAITGLSLALNPGVYWFAGVVQGTVGSQPTMRVITGAGIMPNLDFGTSTPGAAAVVFGFNMTGVTGALPGSFVFSSLSSQLPRAYLKVA